jgi:serine protease Do
MMYDDEDKFEETESNQPNNSTNESEASSGTYRMTREDLKDADLYTRTNDTGRGNDSYYQNNYRTDSDSYHQNNYSYYNEHTAQNQTGTTRHPKRKAKKSGFGMKVIKAACLGIVFGLTASLVMFGFSKASGVSLTASGQNQTVAGSEAAFNVNIVKTSSVGVQTTDAEDVSDIVDQVMPGIVAVNTTIESTETDWFGRQYTQEAQGAGSGIIISEADGTLYLLTNYHVIEDAKDVTVQFVDESTATATVKGYDSDGDIAVLMVDMSQLSDDTKNAIAIMVMGDSDDLKAGNSAIAIGNALGYGQSVTTGIISAVNREVALTDKTMTLIQTSAAINPGNSGGALLNGKGEVIGINTVKYSDTDVEGMGYAIPINTALETAKGIIDGTIVVKTDENTAYLGITGGTLSEDTASKYNAPAGVYISNVASGSAAQRAGLQSGCIITGFNGETITTMEDLQAAIEACAPGDTVTITAQFPDQRGNYTEQTLTTIMGAKSEIAE